MDKKIEKYLKENKYNYKIIEHKTTFTAWDTAQTEKVRPQEVAKALVMKVETGYVLALISSNRNLDKAKLLKTINAERKKKALKVCKKIDLAKEAWMKKNLPGRVGATPPFRELTGLDVYADSLVLKNKKIYVGSGDYTESLLINTGQYIKKEEPVKGSFSRKK